MKKSLFFLLGIIGLFAILSGCNTSNSATNGDSNNTENTKETVITHSMGEATIPSEPKRIVVLDPGALDNILALGIKPVGATTMSLELPFPKYLEEQTEDIANLGTAYEPNLEAISKLNPDIIFGNKEYHEALYEQLKLIAPTVIVKTAGTTWKENLKLQAESLGVEEKGSELLNDYQNRINLYKEQSADEITNTEISLLRARSDKVSLYLRQSFSGSIIEELGFSRPSSQSTDEFSLDLNNEAFPDMDADYIFWFTRDEPNIIDSDYLSNPLWNSLEAVKNNHVYNVGYDTWLSGLGIQAANHIIDDVEKHIK